MTPPDPTATDPTAAAAVVTPVAPGRPARRGRRPVVLTAAAAGLAGLVTLLGACTGSHGSGSPGSAAQAQRRAIASLGTAAAPAGDMAVGAPAAGLAPSSARTAPAAPGVSGDLVAVVTDGRSLIRTAMLTVVVPRSASVAQRADAAEALVVQAGGVVDRDDRTTGRHPSATLVLRVPPSRLTAVLASLDTLGHERSRQVGTRDVTSTVADVGSRVASARDSIARLRTLYAHATKVGDVIAIEGELSARESALESLEARQRALAAETALATVTLDLVPAAKHHKAAVVPHHHRSGFLGGLLAGWHAFGRGAALLATGVGAALPFVVLLAVLGLGGWWAAPRLRRHLQAAPPEAEST